MALESLPLYFGFNRMDPIGNVSIFDKAVEQQFVYDLELVTRGRVHEVPRYLVSFEGRALPQGIEIVSFAFVQDPVPVWAITPSISRKEQQ